MQYSRAQNSRGKHRQKLALLFLHFLALQLELSVLKFSADTLVAPLFFGTLGGECSVQHSEAKRIAEQYNTVQCSTVQNRRVRWTNSTDAHYGAPLSITVICCTQLRGAVLLVLMETRGACCGAPSGCAGKLTVDFVLQFFSPGQRPPEVLYPGW